MDRSRLFSVSVALLWVAAFALVLPVFHPFTVTRLAAIACCFTALALAVGHALATDDGLFLPRTALLPVAGAFWLLAAGSVVWSAAPFISIQSFAVFSLMPASALAFLALPPSGRGAAFRLAAWCGGTIFGGFALWAIMQYLFLPGYLVHGQIRHPFESPNTYAAFLIPAFFGGVAAMIDAPARLTRNAGLLLAALALAAMIFTGARAPLFALAGGVVLFIVMTRGHLRGHGRCGLTLAAVGLAALAATIVMAGGETDRASVAGRVAELALADNQSIVSRLALWQAGLTILKDHLPGGIGMGMFSLFYPEYRLAADRASSGLMAHSDPLQFAIEMGPLAPVLFYAFLALAALRMKRAASAVKPVALFCALAALVVHTHVDFNFYIAPILVLCGPLLAAWMTATGDNEAVIRRPRVLPSTGGWALAVLPAAALLFVLQGVFISEYHVDRARALAAEGRMEDFADAVNAANRAGFGENARAYVLAATVPAGLMAQHPDDRAALFAQADGLLKRAERLNPRLSAIYYYCATIRIASDPEMRACLERALRLDPRHEGAQAMKAALQQ